MLLKLDADVRPHGIKENFYSFAADEFEGRHEIRVAGHHHDGPDHLSQGKARHIHPDPHIHALLRDVEHEVVILKGAGRS